MILGSYCLGWMTVPHAFSSIGTIGASGHDSLIIAHIARVERRSAASVYSVEMSGASAKPCGVRAWSCLSARGRTDAARATQQLSRTMASSRCRSGREGIGVPHPVHAGRVHLLLPRRDALIRNVIVRVAVLDEDADLGGSLVRVLGRLDGGVEGLGVEQAGHAERVAAHGGVVSARVSQVATRLPVSLSDASYLWGMPWNDTTRSKSIPARTLSNMSMPP